MTVLNFNLINNISHLLKLNKFAETEHRDRFVDRVAATLTSVSRCGEI